VTTRFADTFFYLGLLDGKDQHHARVVAHATEQDDFLITTRWVLAETANAFAGSQFRATVAAFLQQLEADRSVRL
jgi:predicted nucleic acid-binding protein